MHTPTRTGVDRTGSLLVSGTAAGPVYVTVSLAQALARDGFDLARHPWSLLATGSLGWIQTANLVLAGLLCGAFAVGLRRTLAPGRAGTWAPRLIGGYAVGLAASGVFRADPAAGFPPGSPQQPVITTAGILHFVSGGVGFACLIAACLVVACRFTADRRPGWAGFSAGTGLMFLAGFTAVAAGTGGAAANLGFTAAVVLSWVWLAALGAHLFRHAAHRPASEPATDT